MGGMAAPPMRCGQQISGCSRADHAALLRIRSQNGAVLHYVGLTFAVQGVQSLAVLPPACHPDTAQEPSECSTADSPRYGAPIMMTKRHPIVRSVRFFWAAMIVSTCCFPAVSAAQVVTGKRCSRCQASVPLSAQVGGSCPNCGAIWSYEQYASSGSFGHDDADDSLRRLVSPA